MEESRTACEIFSFKLNHESGPQASNSGQCCTL